MHIEKIEFGPEKTGLWSEVSFIMTVLLAFSAAGISSMVVMKIIFSDSSVASTRPFIEYIGKLLAFLLFVLAAIIYLYVKGLLQDEYVTTVE
jgi:cadmium resistance protein CadD (predicted permease)